MKAQCSRAFIYNFSLNIKIIFLHTYLYLFITKHILLHISYGLFMSVRNMKASKKLSRKNISSRKKGGEIVKEYCDFKYSDLTNSCST